MWFSKRNMVITLLLVIIAFQAGMSFAPRDGVIAQPPPVVLELESAFTRVYEQVAPSVVAINADERIGSFFDTFGSGSGFVIDTQGHIATNYHVVDEADRIVVNFWDGTIVQAEVIGLDADADIAVLKVDVPAERLHPVRFADSESLIVGQIALAIGSPFGQRWTLTSGIVSALDRTMDGLAGFSTGAVIQTDTAINPGNSGGPLLNLNGEVIGVNTQILSDVRANSGVGFAVPSNLVSRAVRELIDNGRVQYSYLGISGNDVDLNYIQQLNLPSDTRGVIVTLVRAGEPAALGGLLNPQYDQGQRRIQSADIIVAIDDEPIYGFATLLSYLSVNTAPGDVVTISVLRSGQVLQLPVQLGARN